MPLPEHSPHEGLGDREHQRDQGDSRRQPQFEIAALHPEQVVVLTRLRPATATPRQPR